MTKEATQMEESAVIPPAGGTANHRGAAGADGRPRVRRGLRPRFRPWLVFPIAALVTLVSAAVVPQTPFPDGFRVRVGAQVASAFESFVENGEWLYGPVATNLEFAFDALFASLTLLAPPLVVAIAVGAVTAYRGARVGALGAATFAWVLLTDLWEPALETIAFMTVAVVLSAVVGIALGLVGASSSRLDVAVRLLVDAMQAFPAFAYMVPVIVVWGIGNAAALVCTIIFAAPPLARMTSVGLRSASPDVIEAAVASGAGRRQLLFGVRFPLAAHSIHAGLNQTIMYTIAMATMAAMIGAAGLGAPVWGGLGRLAFGDALEAGIALVLVAMLLDRLSSVRPADQGRSQTPPGQRVRVIRLSAAGALVLVTAIVTVVFRGAWQNFGDPPWDKVISLQDPVAAVIEWLNVGWGSGFDAFRDTVQTLGLNPLGSFYQAIPWYVVFACILLVCAVVQRFSAALFTGLAVLGIGALGMWPSAAETLAVVTTAIVLALAVAFPLGVLMSASDHLESLFKPILDVMQTLPVYLFVIPSVILLGTGEVAGAISTVIAASPPVIRYTNAALRGVDPEVVEASVMLGASRLQILRQVRIPLGLPTLMVGVNQAVIIAMAMAVVSAFIGSPGLGQDILYSIQRLDLARGIEAGLAMLLLAVIIDRIFQGTVRMLSNITHTSGIQKEADA